MICQYGFYKDKEDKPRLYCKLNKQFCIYSKYCGNEKRYIHTENYKECYIMDERNNKEIPQGACRVRFTLKGNMYVEIDDNHVVQIPEIKGVNNYVYVRKINGQYEAALKPFTEIKEEKKTTTRKKK